MIDFNKNYKVHFIGVGGISMHALAIFCADLNWKVTGSDIKENEYTIKCREKGIKVFLGHNKNNIDKPDFIVKTGAIKLNNEEIVEAINKGMKVYDRADFLQEITKQFKIVIGIAGCHGKSTTSDMIYEILMLANKSVSCHIGAEISNARLNINDEILVLEACEFNKSFLKFKINIGAVLNVDKDHIECYGGMYQLKMAYKQFLKNIKEKYVLDNDSTKFINYKNLHRVGVQTIDNKTFKVNGKKYKLNKIFGKQYVEDAGMAVFICEKLGIKHKIIYKALYNFKPLKRRQETIGKYKNSNVIVDYAHHPTELKYLIDNFKNKTSLLIFQPHTYSRTKYLFKDFVNVLKNENCIILKEYSARENSLDGETAKSLYNSLNRINPCIKYVANREELLKELDKIKADNYIFAGAGDIDKIAYSICDDN